MAPLRFRFASRFYFAFPLARTPLTPHFHLCKFFLLGSLSLSRLFGNWPQVSTILENA